jgi:putative transport protein
MRIVAAEDHKEAIVAFCGKEAAEKMIEIASSPITTRLIRVTRTEVNGLPVNDLHLSRMDGVNITRVFRSGMTLFPYQQLRLQLGDVVYCVGPERSIGRLADKLGNEERKLDHPNIVSIFLGIALGILIGSLPILVPGMPVPLKLGLAGGPLIVAILIGYLGPRFRLVTYTTYSANLMVRELGISLFLASVGLAAGDQFVAALSGGDGLLYAFCGIFITLIPLLVVGIIGRKVCKMNYHTIVGMVAGATTDPPALAYANTLSERNVSAIAYSTVYPLSMFLRILSGQIILLLLWAYVS